MKLYSYLKTLYLPNELSGAGCIGRAWSRHGRFKLDPNVQMESEELFWPNQPEHLGYR